jgi:hypothetical protein
MGVHTPSLGLLTIEYSSRSIPGMRHFSANGLYRTSYHGAQAEKPEFMMPQIGR